MASDLTNSGVPERQEKTLAGYYVAAAARLREMILHPYGKTDNARAFNQARAAQLIRQVQQIVTGLDAATAKWVGKNVPQAYQDGLILAEQQAIDAGVRPPDAGVAGSFTLHDRRTVETFAQDTMATLHTANVSIAANITRVLRATADQSLSAREINQVLATGVIEGRPRETIRRLKEEYERVNEGGIITIVNKSGNPMTFTARHYATMVARTKTREATVVARHGRLADLGLDLVAIVGRISDNFCTAFLGQVFSLSGKHPKYPAYSSLPGGGPPFHPNCSKSTRPFVEELANDKQLDAANGVQSAGKLLGMDATQAQRAYKDLQIRKQVEQSYKRITPVAGRRIKTHATDDPQYQESVIRSMGVRDVSIGARADIGEQVAKALQKAVSAGLKPPESIRVSIDPFVIDTETSPYRVATYRATEHRIYFNPDASIWRDPAIAQRDAKLRWLSTGSPMHSALHELAQSDAHSRIGDQAYARLVTPFESNDQRDIAKTVSIYAGETKLDFLAEVTAARILGRWFDDDVMRLYRKLGGL